MTSKPTGWYAKVSIVEDEAETRWVSVENFWISVYSNMKDKKPVWVWHISLLEILNGYEKTGQLHSLIIKCGHTCNYSTCYIYTPNQFDIAAIKEAIANEQQRWEVYSSTISQDIPYETVVDLLGKFLYRECDRLRLRIDQDLITVKQLDQPDILVPIDSKFDVHPTLESEDDVKWIQMRYSRESLSQTLRIHCQDIESMKKVVTLSLQCRALRKDVDPEE